MKTLTLDELLIAIGSGKPVSSKDITETIPDIDVLGTRVSRTVLMAAAFAGRCSLISALVESGANVNTANSDGFTALHEAAGLGQQDAVEILLDFGANIEAETRWGETPLILAAAHGHIETVRALLRRGANILHCNVNGATAEVIADDKDENEVVAFLREAASENKEG